jgi:RNA polymerase sigma-70 factor (ECF subfamily)
LLARVADGDQQAFAELYDTTSSRIYGMVLRTVRNPAYSEETTQEVYLQIWRTAAGFDASRGSALAWMMTLAHRRAIDRVRSEQAGIDRDALYAAGSNTRPHDEVVESVTRRLESEDVFRCLDSLSDKQREAIGMAYYQGFTYSEVASRIGVALPTVKSRIRDALIRLQTCLGVTR